MASTDVAERWKRFEIPGRVTALEGNGELPKLEIHSDTSTAEIYLHGAHVTDFRRRGEPPLLFTSQFSRFERGKPIRGGIPLIFPWFGAREGGPMHGFARLTEWALHEVTTLSAGAVTLRFSLPETAEGATWPPFLANYVVTVADTLTAELLVTNASAEATFSFETCLHTYLAVGDIEVVTIHGLHGAGYLDKVENFAARMETDEALRIRSEVDRVYHDTTAAVEVRDPKLGRRVRIEKSGSASTVVWNPWIAKAQQMPDFGDEEYRRMVCVESGNVAVNKVNLPPGQTASLRMELKSSPL